MSVVDLLAEQPETILIQMRDNFRRERDRLDVELDQVEQALAKLQRRGGGRPSSSARTGETRLTRSQVFEVVKGEGRAMSPADVRDVLMRMGYEHVTTAQVRNHLIRLHEINQTLVKLPDNRYILPSLVGVNGDKTEAHDPLSTESAPHRQELALEGETDG